MYCYRSQTTITTVKTTIPTIRTPTPIPRHELTDGYWCLVSDWMVSSKVKTVKDCYQFLPDGGAAWGNDAYSDPRYAIPMTKYEGRQWLVNSKGQYEIFTQVCTFDGYTLGCPGFNPHTWSPTGI